jgi:hypothetical protein
MADGVGKLYKKGLPDGSQLAPLKWGRRKDKVLARNERPPIVEQ